MTTSKLPAHPSLESLRKQAKKLARSIIAGDASAVDRAPAQLPQAQLPSSLGSAQRRRGRGRGPRLPQATLPLSLRSAQLVLAREYGFAGWRDLVKEVEQHGGNSLEW